MLEDTATAEVDFLLSLQSVPVRKRHGDQLDVELTRVVDLTDLSPLTSFGWEPADLLGQTVDSPRFVGRAVSWLGCAGLLVPSARHPGTDLVIYTNQMAASDRVDLVR
jgi:RES domain-containing protein